MAVQSLAPAPDESQVPASPDLAPASLLLRGTSSMREAVVAVELYVLGNESATAAHKTLLLVWGFVTGVVVGLEVAEERQDGRRSSGRDGPWTL